MLSTSQFSPSGEGDGGHSYHYEYWIRLRRADVPVRIRSSVVQIQVERPALSVIVGVAAAIGIALRIPSAIHISDSLPGISFRCAEHLTFHLRGWGEKCLPRDCGRSPSHESGLQEGDAPKCQDTCEAGPYRNKQNGPQRAPSAEEPPRKA